MNISECKNRVKKDKILLMLLPFWTPLIPPQGIGSLKEHMEKHGYQVRAVDATVETMFRNTYSTYFNILREFVPENKQGSFYNIGHNVLEDHLMVHINYTDEEEYRKLVKEIYYQTFFLTIEDSYLNRIIDLFDQYYENLQDYIVNLIEEEKPTVFGLTAYAHTLSACLFAFRFVKEKYPHIMNVMGGAIFLDRFTIGSPDYEYLLSRIDDIVDKIIIGEGEILLLKLLEGEFPESQKVLTIKDIDRQVIRLDQVELPDLSDFNMESYPYLGVIGSKSCPFNCSFCAGTVYFGEYRHKEAKQIVEEMKTLYHRYGNQIFFMCDSLLNPIIHDLSLELINSDFVAYFDGYFRVDEPSANLDNTIQWRRGGFYRARIGIESGSQHVLDLIDKEIKVEQSKATLVNLAEAGIKTTAYLVAGLPGETEEDFQMTLDFIEEMKDYIYQVEVNPFRYYYTGQPNSHNWEKNRILLFPENARELLIYQTWVVNERPLRQERFERLFKIAEFCKELGVPNPYSISEIYEADKRWKKLHKNAVPSLIELKDKTVHINECKMVKKLSKVKNTGINVMEFNF